MTGSAMAARHAVARERAAIVLDRRIPDRTQLILDITAADVEAPSHLVCRRRQRVRPEQEHPS